MSEAEDSRALLLHRIEPILIFLICLHSFLVGFGLLLAPGLSVRFAGWQEVRPLFFPRQAGVFHIVLAAGYMTEYLRSRGVALILIAKSCAFCFLLAIALLVPTPWAVPFCGVLDGMMAAAVYIVRRGRRASVAGT